MAPLWASLWPHGLWGPGNRTWRPVLLFAVLGMTSCLVRMNEVSLFALGTCGLVATFLLAILYEVLVLP